MASRLSRLRVPRSRLRSSPRSRRRRSPSAPVKRSAVRRPSRQRRSRPPPRCGRRPSPASSPWRSIIATERNVASGLAIPCPAMSGAEPWTGSKTPGPPSPRLADGQHPERAGDHRRLVAEDVAEHVLGDDHVEPRRSGDELHRGVVDQQVVELDVGVVARRRSLTTSRHSREVSSTFALSTEVTAAAAAPRRGAAPPRRRPGRSARSRRVV